MNRIIAHFLQKTGFAAVFIGLSYVCACAQTAYSDKPDPNGLAHRAIPFVTLYLVFQFGAYLRREITDLSMRWRWLVGAFFFLGTPGLLRFYNVNQDVIARAFNPPIHWDYVLEGFGTFYRHVAAFWMPAAGLLSLVASVSSFEQGHSNEDSEQAAPSNGG